MNVMGNVHYSHNTLRDPRRETFFLRVDMTTALIYLSFIALTSHYYAVLRIIDRMMEKSATKSVILET